MLRFLKLLILCPAVAPAEEWDSRFAAIPRNDSATVEALLHRGADPPPT
jgi:hypothetical protein